MLECVRLLRKHRGSKTTSSINTSIFGCNCRAFYESQPDQQPHRKVAALDKTILTACLCKFSNLNHIFVNNGAFVHCFFLEFAMSKYSSVLNDKSANFRRYQICKLPQDGLSLSCCSYVFIF